IAPFGNLMAGILALLGERRRAAPLRGRPARAVVQDAPAAELLGFAREIIYALEQFVISTSALDAERVVRRLRRAAGQIRPVVARKGQEDRDRVNALAQEVSGLETALAAERGRAMYDTLTGLYHRGAFQDRYRAIAAERRPFALAVLDLDDFRTINESLGHVA